MLPAAAATVGEGTMSSRIGEIQRAWTNEEHARLDALLAAGWTTDQIAADLGRTHEAIKTRRRKREMYPQVRQRQAVVKPMAAPAVRVQALARTIAAAASERQPDEAYLRELRKGLVMLKWRDRQTSQNARQTSQGGF
jgi:IS30 family transposase